jgi:outer membrane lipoprotein
VNILALLAVVLALLVQGCSYAISPEVARNADRSISFQKLHADPLKFTGKTVILGGVIVRTKNLKKGTLIEVLQKELDYWGKPRRTERTGGRFIVVHPRHLDAMIFAPGRELTVAGEVTDDDQKTLGENAYSSPVIRSRELKLWPQQSRSSWEKPEWIDPLYDPGTPQGKYGY